MRPPAVPFPTHQSPITSRGIPLPLFVIGAPLGAEIPTCLPQAGSIETPFLLDFHQFSVVP